MTPSDLGNLKITSAIRDEENWDSIKEKAKVMMDRRWLANVKQETKSELTPAGHNLDAVVKFKKHCDTKDPYYVYKINF